MKTELNIDDFDAIIFDFDGTLVDSLGLWHQIDIEYLGRHGFECPEDLSEMVNGMSFTETAEYFKMRFGLPYSVEHIKNDWIDLSIDHYMNDIGFKPGAKETLLALKRNGAKIGIATSNNAFITERYFREKAENIVSSFNYACDAKMGKPAPYVFLNAAKNLGADPKKCLAFEDTIEGVMAAKRAGMTVVGVKDHYSRHQEMNIKNTADYYIEDYGELSLKRNNGEPV